MGHRCPGSGKCYKMNDPRLSGYGNPPSSPDLQRQFPGAGTFPMQRELIPMEELPPEIAATVPEPLQINIPQAGDSNE